MRNRFKIAMNAIAVLLAIMISLVPMGSVAASTVTDGEMEYLRSVMEMVKERYRGDITSEQLVEGALKGVFDSMDPYSQYFTPEEAAAFMSYIEGSYNGIGIAIERVGQYIYVIKVFSGSPAEAVGLHAGDRIVEADGKSLIGASTDEAIALIRGDAGTTITLGILRDGAAEATKMDIVRDEITITPVSWTLSRDTAYIRLESFNESAVQGMEKALAEVDKRKIRKVVLDIRNNPGGLVDSAVEIARMLVPKGLITKLDYKSDLAYEDEEYYSSLDTAKYKLVLLVNGQSASASEILAGAVQDRSAGTLVGIKTYGKGVVQRVTPILTRAAYEKYGAKTGKKIVDIYELIGKYGIAPTMSEIAGYTKMTVAAYITPNGRIIDGVGLTPDVEIAGDQADLSQLAAVSRVFRRYGGAYATRGLDVKNAEAILRLAGYDLDIPDLILDDKSKAALKEFQKDLGLDPSGNLDSRTILSLNHKLTELRQSVDAQYAKAMEILDKQ